ncbi:MAG: FISUMP domain-containing protein [bacterium]|nr:FISUMP domain-containing protein [bacterium]
MSPEQKPKPANLATSRLILAAVILISFIVVIGVAEYLVRKPLLQNLASFFCGTSTVSDIDNNIYNTVQIGEQCWLKENLKVTKNPAGKSITRYCYNNDPKICETDGGLYDWNTAMNKSVTDGAQGICPNGWHVPKDSEWYVLENGLKDNGETCLKDRNGPGGCATAGIKLGLSGSSGFEGIGCGERSSAGFFYGRNMSNNYWTSADEYIDDRSNAWSRYIFLGDAGGNISRTLISKANGFSLRCLKD